MKIASTITVCLLLAAVLSRAISFSSVENRHGSEEQGGGGSGSGGRSTSNLGVSVLDFNSSARSYDPSLF